LAVFSALWKEAPTAPLLSALMEDSMITPARRGIVSAVSMVSLAVAGIVTPAITGCARMQQPVAWDASAQRAAFRFDNEGDRQVDVFLVADQREWRLGRVAPGARMTLRIPEEAITSATGFVRLAVVTGDPMSVQGARDPRAIVTIAQPVSQLLLQRWTFVQGQGRTPQVLAARADGGHP
jgi:hypothetical protein